MATFSHQAFFAHSGLLNEEVWDISKPCIGLNVVTGNNKLSFLSACHCPIFFSLPHALSSPHTLVSFRCELRQAARWCSLRCWAEISEGMLLPPPAGRSKRSSASQHCCTPRQRKKPQAFSNSHEQMILNFFFQASVLLACRSDVKWLFLCFILHTVQWLCRQQAFSLARF